MRYSKLSTDTESQSSIKEEDDPTSTREASWLKSTNTNLWLLLALVVSLAVNVFLAGRAREETCLTDHRAGGLLSQYAHLSPNTSVFWDRQTPYDKVDENSQRLWDEISIDDGIIALTDDYATLKGLPLARRFPWDERKGLYIIQAYHELHCLKLLRTSVMESARGVNQTVSLTHLTHCLGELRDDVICHADDTPNASPFALIAQTTQWRRCRSWTALQSWAQQHNACYSLKNGTWRRAGDLDRFGFCPKGSPYVKQARERLGEENVHIQR